MLKTAILQNNLFQLLGMFQNNLSSLSVAEIQQFLDEQTFREIYGQYPLMAFNNIIKKISAQVWWSLAHNLFNFSLYFREDAADWVNV